MDGKLLEILCCPISRQPVNVLDAKRSEALQAAIAAGTVSYVDDTTVVEEFNEILVTDDQKVLYLVIDGIPVMLPERGIGTTQFENFAAGRI